VSSGFRRAVGDHSTNGWGREVQAILSAGEPEVIRYARKAAGLTQVELAGILEVTAETISRWENGAEPFKRNVSLALAKILELIDRHGVAAIQGLAESALPAKGEVVLKVG
jgi:DNA-binding transcriptional regulator YiaG